MASPSLHLAKFQILTHLSHQAYHPHVKRFVSSSSLVLTIAFHHCSVFFLYCQNHIYHCSTSAASPSSWSVRCRSASVRHLQSVTCAIVRFCLLPPCISISSHRDIVSVLSLSCDTTVSIPSRPLPVFVLHLSILFHCVFAALLLFFLFLLIFKI